MDDFVGTQEPRHRLKDPVAAVEALERAVPGLGALRLPAPRSLDWDSFKMEAGTDFPADFKLLCELYPAFELGGFLGFGGQGSGGQGSGEYGRWLEKTREELDVIDEWLEDANLSVPMSTYPAPGGLLVWATSTQGDFFLWSTTGASPEEWVVTVASRSGAWWNYAGGVAQFMADLVSGELELWGLPSVSPEVGAW
ncbi:SMI1/KNR4 family protein [Kitasatospora sp. NPDC002227]|uniref:SMI1/KNR4 family protein n=1 Tax=Kitasatospora sp. NPDC002227 TaxID=3154773 RepID=UPI00331B0506